MQNNTLEEIKIKLLKFLDAENNVVNLNGVQDVLIMLERFPISKEDLQRTRIGKYVNEMRRKTTDRDLAKRTKALISHWQKVVENEKTESQKQTLQPSAAHDNSNDKIETIKNESKNRPETVSNPSDIARLTCLNDSKINLPRSKHVNGKLIDTIKSTNCDKSFNSSNPTNNETSTSELNSNANLKTQPMQIIKENGTLKVNSIKKEILHQIHKNGKMVNGALLSAELEHNILNNKRKIVPEPSTEMPKKKKIKIESLDNGLSPNHLLKNGKIESSPADTKILICKVHNDLKCTISTKRISPEPSSICDPNSSKILPSLSSNHSQSIPKAVVLNMQKANSINGSINSGINNDTKTVKNGKAHSLNQLSTSLLDSSNILKISASKKNKAHNPNSSLPSRSNSHVSRIPSLPDLKQMISSKPTFTNRKIETTAEIYKKLQQNGIVKAGETPPILRQITKTRLKDKEVDDDILGSKKEKSTDCDSALIPLLCVHG